MTARDRADETTVREAYSKTVIDHALRPRNLGPMDNTDGFARVTGPCGDTMEIWLKVRNDVLTEVSFLTDGCATTIAAGSMVTELATGRAIGQALAIRQQDVLDALGGLPEESRHCARLAANTLSEAVRDCVTLRREPWKRYYRRYQAGQSPGRVQY